MLASTALAACGGGGGGGGDTASQPTPVIGGTSTTLNTSNYSQLASVTAPEASRFLLQAQFSASDADIAAVQSQGYVGWLQNQFAKPSGILGWDWLNAQGYGNVNSSSN